MMMKISLECLLSMFIFSHVLDLKSVISLTPEPQYVNYNCQKTNNTYISGSSFHLALNDTLFLKLPEKASLAAFMVTNGTGIDQVNALFYCRANIGPLACQDCVMAAAEKITRQCQYMKEAIVWFKECTLRYSNRSIFSIDEEAPVYIYTNTTGILNDYFLEPFKDQFDSEMAGLVKQAAYNGNLRGFAAKDVSLSSSALLHCVVQCSPDITGAPCERCLLLALKQRDKWADTMIFMPSCFIRIDLCRSTSPPIVDPPPGLSTIKIVCITLVFAIIAIAVAVFCYTQYPPFKDIVVTVFSKASAIFAATFCCFLNRSTLEGCRVLRKFTFTQLSKATRGFRITNLLGEGGFSRVYRGVIRGKNVAVKQIKEGIYPRDDEFLLEVYNNFSAEHDNIVKVVGYCNQEKHKLLVYELVENNCLHKHLHGDQARPGQLTWKNRMDIAKGTARGLQYLHAKCEPIIHRDIKSSNILLDSHFQPKVADFGLARVFPEDVSHISTDVKGTYSYLDPEYISSRRLTEKSDVYSFGIVLLELITGKSSRNLNSQENKSLQLLRGLDDVDALDGLVDKHLNGAVRYDRDEMARMIICATMCVHPSSKCRLSMSQVVTLLEVGVLPAVYLVDIVAYARSDLKSSTASPTHLKIDRFELKDLRKLAIEVHEKWDQGKALQQSIPESSTSNVVHNHTA